MNYETASDLELNKRLAELLGNVVWDLTLPHGKVVTVMRKTHNSDVCKIPLSNYCNSWADMGPLIEHLKIGLSWGLSLCKATAVMDATLEDECFIVNSSYEHSHPNPLRAAVIVAIQVLEGR